MARRLLVAVVLGLSAFSLAPGGVAADSSQTETATTTYVMVPAKGRIDVTIDLRVENHVPSTTQSYTCVKYLYDPYYGEIPYDATCTKTTNYYINNTAVWAENAISNLAIKADAGKVTRSVVKKQGGYTLWKIGFSNIFNGQVRKIHVTYSIPSGKPRTSGETRVGAAYARFCATGNGVDGGSVNVVVPSTFTTTVVAGDASQTSSGGSVTYRSGTLSKPLDYYLCLEGTNEAAYQRTTVTAPDGRSITIASWPEDASWLSSVQGEATTSIAQLEQLIGRPIPETGPLTVQEVAETQLGDYVGTFDASSLVANVSEAVTPGTVAHELSHAWFNSQLFADRWLSEGSAGWAERASTGGAPCTDPGTYPGTGSPDLKTWTYAGPKATDQEKAIITYNYDASCYLVTSVAQAINADAMRDVFAYLVDRKIPYLPDEPDRLASRSITWQTWLDVVDEVGLVPSGSTNLDEMQAMLANYGIASDQTQLSLRSQARTAYHLFDTMQPSWTVPTVVRRALAEWRFSDAITGLDAGSQLRTVAVATDAVLPEAAAVTGSAKSAFEQATSLADLQQAVSNAEAVKSSAEAVAAAVAASNQQGDVLAQIGLIGTDLAPLRASAVTAVQAADPTKAEAQAAELTRVLDQAPSSGTIRVGGVLLAALVVGVGTVVLVRRRRRTVLATVGEAAVVSGPAPIDITQVAVVEEPGPQTDATPVDDEVTVAFQAVGGEPDVIGPTDNPGPVGVEPAADDSGVEGSLRTLERLHSEGLLTDEEYAAQRATIINRI